MSSAAVSVILLFIVTRALNSASADTYSFAYAIANLFVIVASFQVRDFQATDIREKYSFDTYFVTRIISTEGTFGYCREITVFEKYYFNNCICFNSSHLKKSIVVRDFTNY